MSVNTSNSIVDLFLSKSAEERELQEDEYIGGDGLIYCKLCKTRKQKKVEFGGKPYVVSCICKCREEELKREEERREKAELFEHIKRLKADGMQDKHLQDWRFEVAEDSKSIQVARKYVQNWKKVKAENLGLLFWGDVGTGKSFAAACIANALIEKGVPVLMTNFSKILNQMGNLYSDERCKLISSFNNYPLLIVDDLGIERNTEYALEQVYTVIDERYKSGLPLIVTTNLAVADLENSNDLAHSRIYSRVLELCTPVYIDGGDRRKTVSREKQRLMKEMLEL